VAALRESSTRSTKRSSAARSAARCEMQAQHRQGLRLIGSTVSTQVIEHAHGPKTHLLELVSCNLEGLQLQGLPRRPVCYKYETLYLRMRRVASYVGLWRWVEGLPWHPDHPANALRSLHACTRTSRSNVSSLLLAALASVSMAAIAACSVRRKCAPRSRCAAVALLSSFLLRLCAVVASCGTLDAALISNN